MKKSLKINALNEAFDKLSASLKKLIPSIESPTQQSNADGKLENVKDPKVTAHKGRYEDGDRLAKIGGFIGSGGPANEHARKTADNTAKTTSLLQKLLTMPGVMHSGEASVYAA